MTTTTTTNNYPMLSVEEARARILALVHPLAAEELPILEALGRVLAEEIVAEGDIPPHANSAMDGYAFRAADLVAAGQPPRLWVCGELAAGAVWESAVSAGAAVRIMTGAPVPAGLDTVVRFEDTHTEGSVVVLDAPPRPGDNVRAAGEDVRAGEVVLAPGAPLRPQEIGLLASVGRARVMVHRRPRVAVLATGDEVWPIEGPLPPGKIRNSNSFSNAAQVLAAGGEPLVLEIARDREDVLAERLSQALASGADLIVTSGGVSVGDFDLVKQALAAQGDIRFWWVNMKPGKPMAFGVLAGVPLLALPGNPVAAMVSFLLFGQPAVRQMLGHRDVALPTVRAILAEAVGRKDGRRHYLRVRLAPSGDGWVAQLTGDQGSGILTSMVAADGLAVIPETVRSLPAGAMVDVILLR